MSSQSAWKPGQHASNALSFEDVAQKPGQRPGCIAPGALGFRPDGGLVTFLHAPDASNATARQLFGVAVASGQRSQLVNIKDERGDEDYSLEEKLRRERARQLHTGITSYAWAKDADVLLVPVGNELYTQAKGGELTKLLDSGSVSAARDDAPILDPVRPLPMSLLPTPVLPLRPCSCSPAPTAPERGR